MIPQDYITAWNSVAPWAHQRQIEQGLIISRAIVAIFSDPFLRDELRFRGGTALNKLHFPKPLRYSEDIDLVRTTAGPIRPLLEHLQAVLDPWLGKPRFDQSPVAPKLKYAVEAEDRDSPGPINEPRRPKRRRLGRVAFRTEIACGRVWIFRVGRCEVCPSRIGLLKTGTTMPSRVRYASVARVKSAITRQRDNITG